MCNVQLPGCIEDFAEILGMFSSYLVERFCPCQRKNNQSRVSRAGSKRADGRRDKAWTSLGTLTVLAGQSGTVPLCFVWCA